MPKNSRVTGSNFYSFVLTYYNNDPYMVMDKFTSEIQVVAASVSINWEETKHNVNLNNSKINGKAVIGLTKADKSRCWVIGHTNEYAWNVKGEKHLIKYPLIIFQNFRKHFPEPAIFDGFKVLFDEFKRYRGGERVGRRKIVKKKMDGYLEKAQRISEEGEKAKAEAIQKDWRWMQYMKQLEIPCPYFSDKGVHDLYKWCPLYIGSTSKGFNTGDFTAIILKDIRTGKFRGLQRIYPGTNKKVFRKGIDPSGSSFTVPDRQPINGEPIYIMEAPADAAMAFKLTNYFSVATMYADNIGNVASMVREVCPDSPIIFVADNDQYGGVNKGVDTCEIALKETEGEAYMLIPQFDEFGKNKRFKDLTDFCQAYGEEKTKDFLLSYKVS